MRTIVLAVVAWLTGIVSCGAYLWFSHDGQPNMAGDWSAAVTAGAVGLTLMVPVAYLPTMSGLKSITIGRRWWLYPVVGASFCVVPWLVVGGIWGGPAVIFTLASPEAVFVYSIFALAGAVFGAGFAWMNVIDATRESERAA